MREVEPPFDIEYKGEAAKVIETDMRSRRIFHVRFEKGTKPFAVTVARTAWDEKFWTSIPEGRQQEAEDIGKLIAAHIRNKNN